MSVRYLITGANGHLGNTIVKMLVRRNKNVRALVLPEERGKSVLPEKTEVCYGDVRDRETLASFFANTDENEQHIVIHCAGVVSIATHYNEELYNVNVTGTKNIVDMSIESGVKRLIYVSSVHAIQERPAGQVIAETDDFDPDLVSGHYAKTKAEATKYVLSKRGEGTDICVVHPSGICGPYDYGRGHLTQLIIDYCKGNLTAGISGGGYDFVDVRDVAEGIIKCAENERAKGCYILSGHYYTIQEVLAYFHKIIGKKKIRTFLPIWFAKATAPLAELYYKILKQPPLYTPYSLFTLTSNAKFSCEKAKKELGYKTRSFKDTINDTYLWLKVEGRV